MTSEDRIWEDLQSRWAMGDTLSEAENAMRLDLAEQELHRKREVDVAGELQRYLAAGEQDSLEPPFVNAVLEGARERRTPHLRLVPASDAGEPGEPQVQPARRWKKSRIGASVCAGLAVAAGVLTYTHEDAESEGSATSTEKAAEPVGHPVTFSRSELVFASGQVVLNGEPISVGQRTLSTGERLATREGQACFTVEPGIDVCLASKTSVQLESLNERDVRVKVLAGQVVAALGKRKQGHRFSLSDDEVTATARGTVFALTKDASRVATRVTVVEGRVEVFRESEAPTPTMVRAHSELSLSKGAPAKSSSVSRNHEAQFLSLVAPRELWQEGELGIIAIGQGPAGAEVSVAGEGPFALPLTTFAPVGQQRVIVRDAQGAESLLDVEVRAGETEHVDLASDSSQQQRLAPAGRPAPKSAQGLLLEARAALKRGDSAGALASYRRLMVAHPSSPEASTVLVTVGKLELRQNSPARALSAFDAYLKRGGPLQPEALAGKIRALRALGQRSAERQAIQRYLKLYPNGFEAVALKKRLEVL